MDLLEMSWWKCAWCFGNTTLGIGAQAALVEHGGYIEGRVEISAQAVEFTTTKLQSHLCH